MSDPISLRLVRPYATEDELIAAEAWTIDRKWMLLLDQPPLAPDTLVRFELLLESGERLLVAEGKVVLQTEATGGPAGVKVRFKRFNAASKAFIERVVTAKATPPGDDAPALAEPATTPRDANEPPPTGALDTSEHSGIRHRMPVPVVPPENRDALLDKLRERAQLAKVREADETDEADRTA